MKVGDKVRVVDEFCGHQFMIGEVVTCVAIEDDGGHKFSNSVDEWYMSYDEYEPVTTKFQVGETYTTASVGKVKCIYVSDKGHMFGLLYDTASAAYSWDENGVYQCAVESERGPYRIKFGPDIEVKYQYTTIEGHPVTIKYTTNDGILDEGSITAEVAEF